MDSRRRARGNVMAMSRRPTRGNTRDMTPQNKNRGAARNPLKTEAERKETGAANRFGGNPFRFALTLHGLVLFSNPNAAPRFSLAPPFPPNVATMPIPPLPPPEEPGVHQFVGSPALATIGAAVPYTPPAVAPLGNETSNFLVFLPIFGDSIDGVGVSPNYPPSGAHPPASVRRG